MATSDQRVHFMRHDVVLPEYSMYIGKPWNENGTSVTHTYLLYSYYTMICEKNNHRNVMK